MDEPHQALLLEFDTDDAEFARGFEAGRLWTLLGSSDDEIEVPVHASNTEMVMRMAETHDRAVDGRPLDDCWTVVTFRRSARNLGPSPRPEAP